MPNMQQHMLTEVVNGATTTRAYSYIGAWFPDSPDENKWQEVLAPIHFADNNVAAGYAVGEIEPAIKCH